MIKEKIDIVIPFVDMNDQEWYNDYKKYNVVKDEVNHDGRFRDNNTLLYLFRSIALYASWINNVFLVVQRESQVPKWINRNTVKVVLHEEFIPKEFLPVYNGLFIQLFFHEIKNLSEKYLCIDDDMLILKDIAPTDFFIQKKIVQYITNDKIEKNRRVKKYIYPIYNSHKIILNAYEKNNIDNMVVPDHGILPYLKKKNKEFFDVFLTEKVKTLNTLYRDDESIITWIYVMNNSLNRFIIKENVPKNKNTILRKEDIDTICNTILYDGAFKSICINDYDVDKEEYNIIHKKLLNCLDKKYFKKCKYER